MGMDEKQINAILNKEYAEFQTSVYDGLVPEGLIQRFINGIMVLPPHGHKILMNILRGIISKTEQELTHEEVGVVIKVLLNIPFDKLYENLFEAIEKHSEFENFVLEYNQKVDDLQQRMNRKKDSMMNLGGVKQTPVRKIIAEA